MNFDLEYDNCFLMDRDNTYSLVIDKDYIKNRSEIKVGTEVEFSQMFHTYKIKSVYYDYINGIYVLGLEE